MNAGASISHPTDGGGRETRKNVISYLQRTEIFREYQKAYEGATKLPLTLRAEGAFQSPLAGSKHVSPFCGLMAKANKSCATCLQFQQRLETAAQMEATTLECFAGFHESAIPVRAGSHLLGYLQTGQVFLQPPSQAHYKKIVATLGAWGVPFDEAQLRKIYFSTPILARKQYRSIIHLLRVFAQHLAALSNQCIIADPQAEMPAIAKARVFIATQQSEDISLGDVAKAVNMSEFYFCKVFRRTTGLTFTDYLARVRVETVKKLLLNPRARMSETAYTAGFQSLSQFNRIFRRVVGEAPSVYHRRLSPTSHESPSGRGVFHAA